MNKELVRAWNDANAKFDAGDVSGAVAVFESIAETSSLNFNTALCHMRLDNLDKAVSFLNEALELDNFSAVAFFMRGVAHFYLGSFEAAAKDYSAAADRLRSNDIINYTQLRLDFKLHRCEIVFNRALALDQLGMTAEADADMSLASSLKAEAYHSIIDRDNFKGRPFQVPETTLYTPPATGRYETKKVSAIEINAPTMIGTNPQWGAATARSAQAQAAPPPPPKTNAGGRGRGRGRGRGLVSARAGRNSYDSYSGPSEFQAKTFDRSGGGGPPKVNRGAKRGRGDGRPAFDRSAKARGRGGGSNLRIPAAFAGAAANGGGPSTPPSFNRGAKGTNPALSRLTSPAENRSRSLSPGPSVRKALPPTPPAKRGGGGRGRGRGRGGATRGGYSPRGGGGASSPRGGGVAARAAAWGSAAAEEPAPASPPAQTWGGGGGVANRWKPAGGGSPAAEAPAAVATAASGGSGTKLRIKCHHKDTRMLLVDDSIDYFGMMEVVRDKFGLADGFVLRFKDEDGDQIPIYGDDDLEAALEEAKVELWVVYE